MAERRLISIELRFVTDDAPEQLVDRVRESVSLIVGRDRLEDFRWRAQSLAPPRDRIRPRD